MVASAFFNDSTVDAEADTLLMPYVNSQQKVQSSGMRSTNVHLVWYGDEGWSWNCLGNACRLSYHIQVRQRA
jgi:hypothetical protein